MSKSRCILIYWRITGLLAQQPNQLAITGHQSLNMISPEFQCLRLLGSTIVTIITRAPLPRLGVIHQHVADHRGRNAV